jgi:hypothetical protein
MKAGMLSRALIVAACASLLVFAAERLEDTSYVPYEHKAIQYFETPADEAVKRLDDAIDEGKTKLSFAPGFSYLPDLLKRLDINIDSQVLVFAQDSFQASVISPQFPRAIYFNDVLAVGYEPHGEVFELSALDPKQGVMFYSLNMERAAKPSFGRREVCLQCHQGGQTLGIPGLVISSQYIPKGAEAEHVRGGFVTDDRTPIEDRWGGWFVGGSVAQKNRGVPIGTGGTPPPFDPARYLSPTSDPVALLTLEHQTRMTDLIVRVGWDTRIAMADGKLEEARPQLDAAIDDMVGYMLFADEAPLNGPVKGDSTFTKTFPERGPKDKQGRSLRDFDLEKRLFKYPLSYMIYTKAFDSLPQWDLERIYRRLHDVLSGKNTDAKFAKLSADDRRNVLEILRATKPNLPAYWEPQR